MTRWRPWLYALVAAALGAYIVLGTSYHAPLGTPGPDIDQAWQAARAVLQGQDAYRAVWPDRGFDFPLYYPLTTAIIAIPLAPFTIDHARLLFVSLTAGIFGYAIGTARPYLWPTIFGMPFLVALHSDQWTPLLTAAMLLPSLGWLAVAKPNVGVAMLAGARTVTDAEILVVGGLLVLGVSLAADPMWPWKWREALAHATHFRPFLLRPGGFLTLLALLRWRDPRARLLLALAVVPVTGLYYDLLPGCLVARTWRQSALLALASHVAWQVPGHLGVRFDTFAALTWFNGTVVLWGALLPALALVLLRDREAWASASWPSGR